jgi:parallel beta-helix repeat protein
VGSLSHNTVITGNLISGNAWAGVWLDNAQNITVTHNTIGSNAAGTAAIPNGHDGVALTDGAHDNMIGGYAEDDKNLISGNTFCGVRIRDGATYNFIEGNLIGLDGTGTTAIPNAEAGVAVFNANENYIGSSAAGVRQFISGNTREGVYIENSSDNFIMQTNRIGVASDESTALGNGLQGIMLNNASSTSVLPSIVAYNGGAGVAVVGSSATSNKIRIDNDIHGNDGLPIDLGNDGHTQNGSQTPPGPNNWLNYPVITGGSGNNVNGTACANCTVYFYQGIGSTVAAGGGGKYLDIYPSIVANGSGNWNVTLPGGLTRHDITTVACEPPCFFTGNTSEMSPFMRVFLPLVMRN